MTKKFSPLTLAFIALWIAQLACNLPSNSATPDTFATLDGLYTASAQTLEAVGFHRPSGLAVANGDIGRVCHSHESARFWHPRPTVQV